MARRLSHHAAKHKAKLAKHTRRVHGEVVQVWAGEVRLSGRGIRGRKR